MAGMVRGACGLCGGCRGLTRPAADATALSEARAGVVQTDRRIGHAWYGHGAKGAETRARARVRTLYSRRGGMYDDDENVPYRAYLYMCISKGLRRT